MRKLFLLLFAVLTFSPAFSQNDPKVQALSERFSKYLVNNVNIRQKGIRFLETTAKLQRGTTLQISVELNKKGAVQDVKMQNGVNEIFDDYIRTCFFLMPATAFSDITIKEERSYIPVMIEAKLMACDKQLADDMEDELGKRKRWKKFDITEGSEIVTQFPKLAEYRSVPDKSNSTVWFMYYRLMNLKLSIPD